MLFDISTSLRWFGPPVGIVRVERELAKWAMANEANCRFVFFDPDLQAYREIRQRYLAAFLDGDAIVDTTGMMAAAKSRPRKTDRVPRPLLGAFLWLTQSRRMAIHTLERVRLNAGSSSVRNFLSTLQQLLGGKKYRPILLRSDGSRRDVFPLDMTAQAPMPIEAGDIVFFASANWMHSNVEYIGRQKERAGIDLVTFCHDIIPLLFPAFFKPHDVAIQRKHFDATFRLASLVLAASQVVVRDIQRYCAEHAIVASPVEQVALGFDLHDSPATNRPSPLQPSQYIMLVSTIEPRKGHHLVQAVWSRLLDEGLPQRLDLKLLLVGRPGWLADDLLKTLSAADRVVIMDDVDDGTLVDLYDHAAFCIYPSEYEGYGLPVVEALGRGKAILASAVGIVPELQSRLLTQLPANDTDAWYAAIKEQLLNSSPRATEAHFSHPTWQDAASQIFERIHARCP